MQSYAVLGLALVAMGEDIGQDMILRQFGHLMHYGEANIRKVVPLAMALVSASNPQMKVYDTLSRYSHDTDIDVAINAIFAMGLVGAGTNNARLAPPCCGSWRATTTGTATRCSWCGSRRDCCTWARGR